MTTSDPRPLLIVAALRQELAPFHNRCRNGNRSLITGMGAARAHRVVEEWLKRHSCRGIVSTGFAGGIQPGLEAGDLVVAEDVVEADSGEHFHPTLQVSSQIPVRTGRLVSSRAVAWTRSAKVSLGVRFQALAVDMETAAVARIAESQGVPWMAVRAVLDPMEEHLLSLRIFRGIRTAGRHLASYLETL